LRDHSSVDFFRRQRDWILKEASPKVGQKAFARPFGGAPAQEPAWAFEFYYFESPDVPATDTVARHLAAVEALLRDAETRFRDGSQAV
jgi:hypothetical protein